jgi:hypothetical protein|tara:strand:- start:585 stop:791 length:207 start_codon:yes stop_codon:yes gene_type:complete
MKTGELAIFTDDYDVTSICLILHVYNKDDTYLHCKNIVYYDVLVNNSVKRATNYTKENRIFNSIRSIT